MTFSYVILTFVNSWSTVGPSGAPSEAGSVIHTAIFLVKTRKTVSFSILLLKRDALDFVIIFNFN